MQFCKTQKPEGRTQELLHNSSALRGLKNKNHAMAIYHLTAKAVSRSDGRSSVAAIAYRSASMIVDERTGLIHDFTKKRGVVFSEIVLPDACLKSWSRSELWNVAESAEKRKDGCTARELEVALPAELDPEQRLELVRDFAKLMSNTEGCAIDFSIHEPHKKGDQNNFHAHIMRTTRKVDDAFGDKLDTEKAGRKRKDDLIAIRETWANLCNAHLKKARFSVLVDHRTLKAQGIDRVPQAHWGVSAIAIERKTGEKSDKRKRWEALQEDLKKKAEVKRSVQLQSSNYITRGSKSISHRSPEKYTKTIDLAFDRVGDTYTYKAGASKRIAFEQTDDKTIRLYTNKDSAIKASLQLAQAKGWEAVVATGDTEFKRKTWVIGTKMGIEIQGYTPTADDYKDAGIKSQVAAQKPKPDFAAINAALAAQLCVDLPTPEPATTPAPKPDPDPDPRVRAHATESSDDDRPRM